MKLKLRKAIVSPVNCIYILDCSLAGDMNSTQRLEDDIKSLLVQKATLDTELNEYIESINVIDVKNHNEFIQAKNKILADGKKKTINPLVLIYGHGENKKGLKLQSGGFINWDLLSSCLDDIITVSQGELTVIGAFCYSYKLVERNEEKLKKRLPFSFYYGYVGKITFGDVENDTFNIIKSFILYGGKDFKIDSSCFSTYSEYDYISFMLSLTIMLAKSPGEIHELNGKLSNLISIKSLKEKVLSISAFPAGETRRAFNTVIRSISLTEGMVCQYMHDTERRFFFLEDLKSQF